MVSCQRLGNMSCVEKASTGWEHQYGSSVVWKYPTLIESILNEIVRKWALTNGLNAVIKPSMIMFHCQYYFTWSFFYNFLALFHPLSFHRIINLYSDSDIRFFCNYRNNGVFSQFFLRNTIRLRFTTSSVAALWKYPQLLSIHSSYKYYLQM